MRTYVAVDGGMSDNLRPMLYGARYEAAIADRPDAPATHVATIAGMHCESGDILIKDVALPEPQVGDVLVTPATGAYGYAMANNYNGVPRPPVIFCRDGEARVVVRRETYEDLRGARRHDGRAFPSRPARPRDGRVGASTRCSPSAPTRSPRRPGAGRSCAGVLTRSRGTFDEILASRRRDRRADRRHRAGARVRAARARGRQAGGDRQQAAAQPARRRAVRRGARGPARSFATRPRSPASCR